MKYCFVKQDGIMDCGVSCLLMIIRTHHGNCSKEHLRSLTFTNKNGTSAYDLMMAGETFGFTSFGLRGKLERMEDDYFPVIAHVVKDQTYQHFVVVYRYNRKKQQVVVADPAVGICRMTIQEFEKTSTNQFIIFIPNSAILIYQSKHPLFAVFRDFITTHKKKFYVILFCSFFYTIVGIILTFSLQIITILFEKTSLGMIFSCVSAFILLILLKSFLGWIRLSVMIRLTHEFDTHLFTHIYHHLFLLPDSYYENRTTGELLARITDLVDLKNILSNFFLNVAVDLCFAIFSLVVLFLLNPILTIVLLLFVALDFLLFICFRRSMLRHVSLFKETNAKFHSFLVDTIGSVSSIRHIGCFDFVEKKFQKRHQEQIQQSFAYQRCWNLQILFKNIIHYTAEIVLITMGCYFVTTHTYFTSISSVVSYLFLVSFFLNPIESIYTFLLSYQDAKEAFGRIEEFYQVEEEEENAVIPSGIQSIGLRHLSYSYRRNKMVLVDFNDFFKAGEKILIYGKSGCGKSTLSKILAGYIQNYDGEIQIDYRPISKEEYPSLRTRVMYVAQNETLLKMSLRDNIIMGRDISDTTFLNVCRMLHIDAIASKHVLAYDMLIEENGSNLSGGEIQRIILARGILKDADMYIFDESLCNMDVTLERDILVQVFDYLRDKIVLVVSHRFYNDDLYDRKIEMKRGV